MNQRQQAHPNGRTGKMLKNKEAGETSPASYSKNFFA
jgi:hypothetical protein